jgi:DNA-directed RNA polymerase III subunit RPC6
MVYACIENSGTAGIWNKTIKNRISAHAQVLERVLKGLTNKGLIKSMSSVKNPGRKMWILAGLQPNEEATGGAWFTNGDLDTSLLQAVAAVVEIYVSEQSWEELDSADHPSPLNNKRKAPADGFDDQADSRSKSARLENTHHHKGKPSMHPTKSYRPFHPGYTKYPTLTEISRHILKSNITGTTLPQNAIAQLLDVMVYDNKLFKVSRRPNSGDDDDPENVDSIIMYRSFKTPQDLYEENQLVTRTNSHKSEVKKAAIRQQQLEEVGPGGASEVPCMSCPVFDICDNGGPTNVRTCKYFDQWYLVLAEADREAGVGVYAPKDKGKLKDKGKGKATAAIEVEMEVDTEDP